MATDPASQRAERDPRPLVALPKPVLPGVVIAAIAAVLAVILFLVLDSRRRYPSTVTTAADTDRGSAFQEPPALALPPEPAPPMTVVAAPLPRMTQPFLGARMEAMPPLRLGPMPTPAPAQPPLPQLPFAASPLATAPSAPRAEEPALVFDEGAVAAGQQKGPPVTGGAATATASASPDDAPVRTTVIGNRSTIMATGTMILAVLETPIDSSRPGLIRAVVSEDARGFDGRRVLVPRGSRLIGEYQSDIRSGQHRVLVNWTRLIRPDGIAIRIGSPAADALGGAGIPGHVNSFFFQRFASAALQSALAVGVALASRPGNGSVIVGLPTAGSGAIGQNLASPTDLQPKITVKQGAVVNVFVAHDLDFSGAPLPRQEGGR